MGEVKCNICNDSGYLINNMGEHRCFDCTAPFDRSRTPGRLPDEPIDPRFQRKPPLEDRVAALERAIAPPQPLTAAEVTEPGWYWYRGEEQGGRWMAVEVSGRPGDLAVWLPGEAEPSLFAYFEIDGTFIGPLRAPE